MEMHEKSLDPKDLSPKIYNLHYISFWRREETSQFLLKIKKKTWGFLNRVAMINHHDSSTSDSISERKFVDCEQSRCHSETKFCCWAALILATQKSPTCECTVQISRSSFSLKKHGSYPPNSKTIYEDCLVYEIDSSLYWWTQYNTYIYWLKS